MRIWAWPFFPNFFMLYGPNTNVGSNSVIFMLEAQARYIVRALRYMRRRRRSYVAVRPATMADFIAKIDEWMEGTVWLTRCSNYFRAANGRVVTQWPRSARAFWGMTRRFRPADYTFDPPAEQRSRASTSCPSVVTGLIEYLQDFVEVTRWVGGLLTRRAIG
jgi:cyclohexanone monooxygenase